MLQLQRCPLSLLDRRQVGAVRARTPKLIFSDDTSVRAHHARIHQQGRMTPPPGEYNSMSVMKNRKFSTTAWLLLAAAAILCAVAPAQAREKNPNIVFMLMDNLGYGELGVYGGGILCCGATPRIDYLGNRVMPSVHINCWYL